MSSHQEFYPTGVVRCQHVKVSGIQCNLAALKNQKLCYFHRKTQQRHNQINASRARRSRFALQLPLLEDLDSIQVAIMQVMHLLLSSQIDHKTAGLLLYALQTASSNMLNMDHVPEANQELTLPLPTSERLLSCLNWKEAKAMRKEFVKWGLISDIDYGRFAMDDESPDPLLAAFNQICTTPDDGSWPTNPVTPQVEEQSSHMTCCSEASGQAGTPVSP